MNEKMRILDMLEKGTITADDAVRLMEAVGPSRPPFINPQTRANMDEKFHKFAKDVGCKAHEIYKDVEPKVKKATQTALEKTASVLDNLAKKLNESLEKCDCDDPDCDCQKSDDEPTPN